MLQNEIRAILAKFPPTLWSHYKFDNRKSNNSILEFQEWLPYVIALKFLLLQDEQKVTLDANISHLETNSTLDMIQVCFLQTTRTKGSHEKRQTRRQNDKDIISETWTSASTRYFLVNSAKLDNFNFFFEKKSLVVHCPFSVHKCRIWRHSCFGLLTVVRKS